MTNHPARAIHRGTTPAWRASLAAMVALALAMAAPVALAHGPPPGREVDTRVLLDDDGLVAYGGCVEGQCQPAVPAEGLDVLALDVREAAFPDGSPAVVLRFLVESEEPVPGASLLVRLSAGGQEREFETSTSDGLAYTSSSFDRVDGPFDVGDGHPKALDGWVAYDSLDVEAGATLEQITVEARVGEERGDVMPGGWFVQGVEVPHVPHDPADPGEALAEHGPGSYALKGPAALVAMAADPAVPDLASGPATVTLTLANAVSIPQSATLRLGPAHGVDASLADTSLSLGGSGIAETALTVVSARHDAVLHVVATTDLGAHAILELRVQAPPAADGHGTHGGHDGHGTAGMADGNGTAEDGQDVPLPLLGPAALAVALAAAARRRVGRGER